jgi:membrane glycosyltransferase
MLHWWLLPLLLALILALWVFYLLVRNRGGPGVRTEGRTLVDIPDDDTPPRE